MAESVSDALKVIDNWHFILFRGEREQINRFLDEVRKRFKGIGWKRHSTLEKQMNRNEFQRNRFYCWNNGPDSKLPVLLGLNRTTDRRVRGGIYQIGEGARIADLAGVMMQILREVLEPAAAAVDLDISYPHLGPISCFGTRTEAALMALSEAGDGQWPLPEEVEPAWRSLIITAFTDNVALKPEELTAWFLANGWCERASVDLTKRFFREAALLAELEEAGRQLA